MAHLSKRGRERGPRRRSKTKPQTLPHPERGRIGGGRCHCEMLLLLISDVDLRGMTTLCRSSVYYRQLNSTAVAAGTDPHLSSPFQGEEAFVARYRLLPRGLASGPVLLICDSPALGGDHQGEGASSWLASHQSHVTPSAYT